MPLIQVTGGGAFTRQNISDINNNFGLLASGLTPGNIIYCNPSTTVSTSDQDGSSSKPYQSLATAYGAGRNGMNDVIVLVGNGAASGTARIDATFTWAKNALHLIGVCSRIPVSPRARIAPSSSTAAFTPYFTISGNGCQFQNIQWFMGFTTGTTNQIGMVLSGQRNAFYNCHIAGLADASSAGDAGSRTLKIGGSGAGENYFENCTIGVDTVTRSAANATLEFVGATPRNIFRWCIFPFMTSAATPLGFLGSASGCVDRTTLFDNCTFENAIQSTSTTMNGLGTLPASAGGLLLFKQCVLVGISEYGTDATTRGQCYIDGLTGAAATSGIAVNPT